MATEQRILISVSNKFHLTVHRSPPLRECPQADTSTTTIANRRRWWTTIITGDTWSVHVPICGRTTFPLAEESPWAVQRGWVVELNKSNAGMTKVKSRIIHLIPFRYYFLLHTLAYIWCIKWFTTDNKSLNLLVGSPAAALTDRENCGREHQQNMTVSVSIKSIEWKTSGQCEGILWVDGLGYWMGAPKEVIKKLGVGQ